MLIYTFRTFPWQAELERQFGQQPFIFGKLKQDLEEFKKLIVQEQPKLIIGIAKSPYGYSLIESKAMNTFNKNKSVIKDGPSEYLLDLPDKVSQRFKAREGGTDSFCNWTIYQLSHFIMANNLETKLVFFHIIEEDISEFSAILKEILEYSSQAK